MDRFQLGEVDVLVCTFGVGATGVTLTRSHTVLLLDRPWTPGDVLQAEDRVRRIGQRAAAVGSLWLSKYPVDEKLDKLLQAKDGNYQIVLSNGQERHRKWFGEAERRPSGERGKIEQFFQQGSDTDVATGAEALAGTEGCSTLSLSSWNVSVRESEKEAVATTNGIMGDLARQLLC